MKRPAPSPSRASDALLTAISLLTVIAMLPLDPIGTAALWALTIALVVWPFGVLLWLARRWARIEDVRFAALAGALIVTAAGSSVVAIVLSG